MNEPALAIRGICPHGKVMFIASGDAATLKACRKDIANMAAAGFTIDRVPAAGAGKSYDPDCEPCDAERQTRRAKRKVSERAGERERGGS